jgi:hypothetical protein
MPLVRLYRAGGPVAMGEFPAVAEGDGRRMSYVALTLLILAVAAINWMAKAPPTRVPPLLRWSVLIGGVVVAVLSTLVIVELVEASLP